MKEFLKANFDKLLLTFIWLVMVCVWILKSGDKEQAQFASNAASGALGALLAIVTGKLMATGTANIERSTVNIGEKPPEPPNA